MAAPETATGGSARDGEHTEVSESDDEWPDVASDHEDEAGMIWPAADSHGRGPEAQGRGSDDVVGSSGAEPFSTTSVDAVSTAEQTLPSQGFHRVVSASAFGSPPVESRSETFTDTSNATAPTGFVERKTTSLGDLFGGDTPKVEADVAPKLMPVEGAVAVAGPTVSPTTAASPFGVRGDGADDDFFNRLASPGEARRQPPPAPFGAPPPLNSPAPVAVKGLAPKAPVALPAVEPETRVPQQTQPARQTHHAQPASRARPRAYQHPTQPATYQQPYQRCYEQQAYAQQSYGTQPSYGTQQYQPQQSYQQPQQYQTPYGASAGYDTRVGYAHQDYAAEAVKVAQHQPRAMLPPTTPPVASQTTFMVPERPVPVTNEESLFQRNQNTHATATQVAASLPYVPPPPADAAPGYDASPINAAYDTNVSGGYSRSGTPDIGAGGASYGAYGQSSSNGNPHAPGVAYTNTHAASPAPAPEPVYDHGPPSAGASYDTGHYPSSIDLDELPRPSLLRPEASRQVPAVPVAKPQFMIPEAPRETARNEPDPDAFNRLRVPGADAVSYGNQPLMTSTLPPAPNAAAAGYDEYVSGGANVSGGTTSNTTVYNGYDSGGTAGNTYNGYNEYASYHDTGDVYGAAPARSNEAAYDTSGGTVGAYGAGTYENGGGDPGYKYNYHDPHAMNACPGSVPLVSSQPVSTSYAQWAPDVPAASGDRNAGTENQQPIPVGAYSTSGSNHATGDAGTARSPHGRPPSLIPSFGFGGKLAIAAPGYPVPGATSSTARAAPGCVRIHNLCDLFRLGVPTGESPNDLASQRPGPGAEYLDSLSGAAQLAFPPGIDRKQSSQSLVGFAEERGAADACGTETGKEDGEALLLGVLAAMLARGGPVSVSGTLSIDQPGGDPPGGFVVQVARLLLGNEASAVTNRPSPGTGPVSVGANSLQISESALKETERLLFFGSLHDALEVAMSAGLWPHAMLLASRIGTDALAAVSRRAAISLCAAGSPLRTLELALCGGGDELLRHNSGHGGDNANTTDDASSLLPRWKEHVAILAANRGRDDGTDDEKNQNQRDEIPRVMTAIGDALWSDVSSSSQNSEQNSQENGLHNAHVLYVLAGITVSPFHQHARVCLLGADHKRFPRTYHANVRAIQKTEILEKALMSGGTSKSLLVSVGSLASMSKISLTSLPKAAGHSLLKSATASTAGNAQAKFLPSFQPYKVLYAGYLAELGFTKQALAVTETVLKTVTRKGFVERHGRDGSVNLHQLMNCAQEMEHRLKGHAGGRAGLGLGNLQSAATSLFGGFSKMFDKGVHSLFGDDGNGAGGGVAGDAKGKHDTGAPKTGAHSRTLSSHSVSSVFSNANATAGGQTRDATTSSRNSSNASVTSVNHSRNASNASNDWAVSQDSLANDSTLTAGGSHFDRTDGTREPVRGSFFRQFSLGTYFPYSTFHLPVRPEYPSLFTHTYWYLLPC
jgi:hypothetical protein